MIPRWISRFWSWLTETRTRQPVAQSGHQFLEEGTQLLAELVNDLTRLSAPTSVSRPAEEHAAVWDRVSRKMGKWTDTAYQVERLVIGEDFNWTESADARRLGAAIKRIVSRSRVSLEQLRLVLAKFQRFRLTSREPVPEAMPLIARLAEANETRPEILTAYVEYLACARLDESSTQDSKSNKRRTREQDSYHIVEDVLRSVFNPKRAEGLAAVDRLRLIELLELVCRTPDGASCRHAWIPAQHFMLLYETKEFGKAHQMLPRLIENEDHFSPDPQCEFAVGMVYRHQGDWANARRRFETAFELATVGTETHARASSCQIESLVRLDESKLRSNVHADVGRWPTEAHRLEELIDSHPPEIITEHFTLLVSLRQRLYSPSENVTWWLNRTCDGISSDTEADLEQEILASSGVCLIETLPVHSGVRRSPESLIPHGHRLLDLGHFHRLQTLFPAQVTFRPDVGMPQDRRFAPLYITYLLRVGATELAEQHLRTCQRDSPEISDALLESQIELAVCRQDVQQAKQLLQSPRAQLLSWLSHKRWQARVTAATGDWPAVYENYRELLQREPQSPWLLTDAGWECLAFGQDHAARDCFQQALSLQPENHFAELGRALAHHSLDLRGIRAIEPNCESLFQFARSRLWRAGRLDLVDSLDTQSPRTES